MSRKPTGEPTFKLRQDAPGMIGIVLAGIAMLAMSGCATSNEARYLSGYKAGQKALRKHVADRSPYWEGFGDGWRAESRKAR